jgi:hypothetical protein
MKKIALLFVVLFKLSLIGFSRLPVKPRIFATDFVCSSVGFGLCSCFCFGQSKQPCKFSSGSGHQQFSSFSLRVRTSCLPLSAQSVVSFFAATSHDRFLRGFSVSSFDLGLSLTKLMTYFHI